MSDESLFDEPREVPSDDSSIGDPDDNFDCHPGTNKFSV